MYNDMSLDNWKEMRGRLVKHLQTEKTKLLCPSDLVCDTERNKDTTVLCIFMEGTGCNVQDYVMTKHKRLVPDKTSVIHVNRYTKRGRPYRKRSH